MPWTWPRSSIGRRSLYLRQPRPAGLPGNDYVRAAHRGRLREAGRQVEPYPFVLDVDATNVKSPMA